MSSLNNFLFIMLFAGIIMIIVAQTSTCPPSKVEYRYVPRNLDQLMEDQNFDKEVFKTVFGDNEIWLESINNEKLGDKLKYNIN